MTYRHEGLERVRFSYPPGSELIAVTSYTLRDALPVSAVTWGRGGWRAESYEYQGARASRITVEQGGQGEDGTTLEVVADYDDLGALRSVRAVYPNGYTRTVYEQPTPKRTVASLSAIVRSYLVDRIPQTIARLRLQEPAYAVVLAYDAESGAPLPPLIGVGMESTRVTRIAEHGRMAAWEYLWNPAEYAHFDEPVLTLDEPELLAACHQLNQQLEAKGGDPVRATRKLLNDVARDLNATSWDQRLQVTADFIVFATDLEGNDTAKNIKAVVPADRLAVLGARGLV